MSTPQYHRSACIPHPAHGHLPGLRPLARTVLLTLWTYGRIDRDPCVVWPSVRTIAGLIGSNPNRVRAAIGRLELARALDRVHGEAYQIRSRRRLTKRPHALALIPCEAWRDQRSDRQISDKDRRVFVPTEQAHGAGSGPTEHLYGAASGPRTITINNNFKSPLSSSPRNHTAENAQTPRDDDDDDHDLGWIYGQIAHADALPWQPLISAAQRQALAALVSEHGRENVAACLKALRRQLLARGLPMLTGPAMLEPAAWAVCQAKHGAAFDLLRRRPQTAPDAAQVEPGPIPTPDALAAALAAMKAH